MADDNNIGAVGILVTGDASTLQASLQAAQATAQKAGTNIAAAFTGAVAPANAATSAIQKLTASILADGLAFSDAVKPVRRWEDAFKSAAQIAREAAAANKAAASSVTQLGAAHGAAVSQIQATSGALRVLEGSGGLRAAERFIASTLGLGGAFQAIFPVVGAIAVAEILGRVVEKVSELYTTIRDQKEKLGGAASDLLLNADTTVDDLELVGVKLDNVLAKLAGRAQNTIALQIHEAVTEADKLAKSLNAGLEAAYKFAKDNQVSGLTGYFTGQASSEGTTERLGGKTGAGGLQANKAAIIAEETAKLRESTTAEQAQAIQLELNTRLTKLYTAAIKEQADAEMAFTPPTWLQSLGSMIGSPFRGSNEGAGKISQTTISDLAALRKEAQDSLANAAKQKTIDDQQRAAQATADRNAAAQNAARVPEAQLTGRIAATERLRAESLKLDEDRIESAKRLRDVDIAADSDQYSRERRTAASELQAEQELAAAKKANAAAFVPIQVRQQADLGKLEGAGKDPVQQQVSATNAAAAGARIQTDASNTIIDANNKAAASADHLATVTVTATRRWGDEVEKEVSKLNKDIGEFFKTYEEAQKRVEETQKRVAEIQEKAAGAAGASGIESQKLSLQRAAALGGPQTAVQQIALQRQIAELDEQSRVQKWMAAEAQAATAEAAYKESGTGPDRINAAEKVAAAQGLAAENALANQKAQDAIDEALQKQTVQYQIQSALTKAGNAVPGAIGGAIAQDIFSRQKHEDVGTAIEKSLKNVGQQLFGQVLTSIIKQLITTIGLNTLGQTIMHALGLTQTAAQTANTAALIANTAALVAQSSSSGISGILSVGEELGGVFDSGGRPPVGVPSLIGLNGRPEIFIPDSAGTIVPAGGFSAGLPAISGTSASGSMSVGEMHFHAHGMTNPKEFVRQVVREIPNFLKSAGPQFSTGQ